MAFTLTSHAFQDGDTIPQRFTCDGADEAPHLAWTDPPEGCAAVAYACDRNRDGAIPALSLLRDRCLPAGIQKAARDPTNVGLVSEFPRKYDGFSRGPRFAPALAMTFEAALGWWLACTVHPHAAWRRLRPAGRALLVGTYFGAGYAAALMALLAA